MLSFFAKKVYVRCSTGFKIHLCERFLEGYKNTWWNIFIFQHSLWGKEKRIDQAVVQTVVLKLKVKMGYNKNFIYCAVSILETLRSLNSGEIKLPSILSEENETFILYVENNCHISCKHKTVCVLWRTFQSHGFKIKLLILVIFLFNWKFYHNKMKFQEKWGQL